MDATRDGTQTGYVYHEIYAWHDAGTATGLLPSNPTAGLQPFEHLDTPETKRRIHELIMVSGLGDRLDRLDPLVATREHLRLVHEDAYIDRLEAESDTPKGGDAGDGISPFGMGGFAVLQRAVGGTLAAFDAVATGAVRNAYALVRPSGHHALADRGMGMAYFANVAIAVHQVRASRGVRRVAVVDWDAHHANGTQQAFAQDPEVLTISLHQDNVFPPGSGAFDDRGDGAGFGSVLNLPLPAGTGDGGYLAAFDDVVVPALERFRPDLVVVASGFDSCAMDPLGRQLLTSQAYRLMTRRLIEVADHLCGGRLAMSHEGGYSPVYAPFCGLAVLEELSGHQVLQDPYLPLVSGFGGQELQPHQRAAIDRVVPFAAEVPTP